MLHPPRTSEFTNTARVIARFIIRVPVLLSCATLAQTSYAYTLAVLLTLSITFCSSGGRPSRAVVGPSLTNWDEAAAYACIASIVFKFAQS